VDALANPSLQRGLSIALAVIAGLGALTCAAILWSARRPMSAQARVLRRRVGRACRTAHAYHENLKEPNA